MFKTLHEWTDAVGTTVDVAGVGVIVIGMLIATGRLCHRYKCRADNLYSRYRQEVGRSILLGLEFLVAGDIIRTVVVAPTMENVKVLGVIILIRTFLSIALEVELDGRWPWHKSRGRNSDPGRAE